MQHRPDHGQSHSPHAGEHATARGFRIAHPLERQNEECRGDQVNQLNELIGHLSRRLNIFSMRSVIRKPLTMLVVDAKTATAPRMVLRRVSCSPASRMAPTTAMAEMALVSDISGVCSSRDTRWMTIRPMKVDSISTNNPFRKSNCIARNSIRVLLEDGERDVDARGF